MKKAVCVALSLLCAFTTHFVVAGDLDPATRYGYSGAYVSLDDLNFRVYLPGEWLIYQPVEENARFMAGSDDQSCMLEIDVLDGNHSSFAHLLQEILAMDGSANVEAVEFNRFPFVAYEMPAGNLFGAVTLSWDGSYLFVFKFSPNTAEFQALARSIMASLEPLVE